LLADGALSAVELTDACLERIAQRNGGTPSHDGSPDAINAWVRVYPELAREQAISADQRRRREPQTTPQLCGIPLALKDLYGVAGLPLTASSRVLEGNLAARDAIAWARLRDQGMVLLGHTHTHEFAAGGTSDQVGNPWAIDRVVGGSSGGSAAALAARMTPAALGSDTCGSLRIPSACCGTSAIKPSHGRVPLDGIIPLAPSLDHPGPMARTVADCSALLQGLLSGEPVCTPSMPPPAPIGPLPLTPSSHHAPLAGLTVALTNRTEEIQIEHEVAAGLLAARDACSRLGARVIDLPAPWVVDWEALGTVLMTELWAYHSQHADRFDRYRPAIAEMVEASRNFTDAQAYLAAQQRRAQGAAAWERWFASNQVDLVLEPTLPITPYGRGPGYDRGHAGGPGDPMIALTALWDLNGMPVVSLPVSWSVGVSLIAPRGREAPLIQAAIDLQEHELGVPSLEWIRP
jgi:aspartyl-tRNA(Asn)/glutamyl-tRNA(Gln) amidotransferase subunit A